MTTRPSSLQLTMSFIVIAMAAMAAQTPPSSPGVPPDAAIRKMLMDRVDVHRQSVGMVVGIIEPSGRRIVTYGGRAKEDTRPLDGDTMFEIGSITKVFTSLLLADAVRRGEVTLADPVSKYLPPGVNVPERGGRSITLVDLSTHTSGLPREANNFQPRDPANPYADYSVAQLYQFLSGYQLTRDIGSTFEYSNVGAGLLGHALTRMTGMDYEALVRARITEPLGMGHTAITLAPDMKAVMATGHDSALRPVPLWDLSTLAGAGALRSSANDLLTFLGAALGYRDSSLNGAFAAMLATRRSTALPRAETGLAWQIVRNGSSEIIWHDGGTAGFRTWIGYAPRSRTGVVVLTNAGGTTGPNDIGQHLLDPSQALRQTFPPPPKLRFETRVDSSVFDRLIGRYQLAPAIVLSITREKDAFFVQLTGQPPYQIFAESEKDYFLKIVDAQLTFEVDAQNKAVAVTLHQNGARQRAPRIEGEPVAPKETTLDPAVLDRYVGRYQLGPGQVMTITRQGTRMFAQPSGQPAQEIFASSEREFFLKVINAQLRFEVGEDGRATALVLLPSGARAPRVE